MTGSRNIGRRPTLRRRTGRSRSGSRCGRRSRHRPRSRSRGLDRAGSGGRGQRHRGRIGDQGGRNSHEGQEKHQQEDGGHGQNPRLGEVVILRGECPSISALGAILRFRRLAARRHASGRSPGVGVVRAASSASVADARRAADRTRSSVRAMDRRSSSTCRRRSRVALVAVMPSVQASMASEAMTSSARAATARSRISPTARAE